MLINTVVRTVDTLDAEINEMRREGLEYHDISIFAEERVEYVHSRVALKPILIGIDQAYKTSIAFENRANTSFGRVLSSRVQKMVQKSESKLSQLYKRKARKYSRERRSIEVVGELISKLFGVPGPEQWKQNTRNILAMKEAIERQLDNSVAQHRDIDQNRHTINQQSEMLRMSTKIVTRNENRLNKVDDELNELESFIEIEAMFVSVDDILESLIDIKRDAKTGRCNEKGLNPEFLIDNLREIESNKNSIAPIFASWEWQKYYNFEMCTLALHDEELWITMRIPIVNLAEQMIRAVPQASQVWIRDSLYSLGFETTLFKFKLHDTFMIMLKTNLELCSTLGTIRVCNVRKTKFREAKPYVVPLDINHNRLLIVANSSNENYQIKSMCGTPVESKELHSQIILKIPNKCALLARSFEVSKSVNINNVSISDEIGTIETVMLRKIVHNNREEPKVSNIEQLVEHSRDKEFEKNNNKTIAELDKVKFSDPWSSGLAIYSSTGAVSIIIAIIIGVVIGIKCCKSCRKSETVLIRLDEEKQERHKHKSREREKEFVDETEFLNEEMNEECESNPNPDSSNSNASNDIPTKKPLDQTTRPRCQFKYK